MSQLKLKLAYLNGGTGPRVVKNATLTMDPLPKRVCRWQKTVTLSILLTFCLCTSVFAADTKMIRAVVGEAAGESFKGKVAVARVIMNRQGWKHYKKLGVFFGVFGLKRDLSKEPKKVWKDAEAAVKEARKVDFLNGATIWGNASDVKKFEKQKWFKRCEFVTQIDGHYFYRELV